MDMWYFARICKHAQSGLRARNVVSRTFRHFSGSMLTPMHHTDAGGQKCIAFHANRLPVSAHRLPVSEAVKVKRIWERDIVK